MLRTLIATGSVATLIALSPVAQAADRQIKTSDLDLSSPKGQAELDKRVMRAARALCTGEVTGTRLAPKEDKECIARAAASAREALAAQAKGENRGG
ncbi:MAG TPA: UrcA family protein [Novosphingobium sp.]|nr:UrcA family protein [Novosphingobium sp.]